MMNDPADLHLWLNRREDVPEALITDFLAAIDKRPLKVTYDTRPSPEFYGGLGWLVPTAVVLFVFKAYFDGFLQEAGKDHYKLLRTAALELAKKFIGRNAPKVTVIGSEGKVTRSESEYSPVFSVRGQINERVSACLLLRVDSEEETLEAALDAFWSFLAAVHGSSVGDVQGEALENSEPLGSILLLAYNRELKRLEAVDPRPKGKGGRDA